MSWDDIRYFACFASSGSLSAAARELNVEHATVSRRIASLETGLNLKLVDRRGRKLQLTPAGAEIAAIGNRMDLEAQQVLRHAHAAASELSGAVTISAPPAFAAVILAAPIMALHRKHPNLRVFISGNIHAASLDRREADIAIRLRRPESGDLTALRLGAISFQLYASRDYLERTAKANWAYVTLGGALATSPQQTELDATAAESCLSTDHIEMQLALTRAGAGVAMLPDFLAADDPGLTPAQSPVLIRDIWLTYHSDLKSAAPVQAVIQELKSLKF